MREIIKKYRDKIINLRDSILKLYNEYKFYIFMIFNNLIATLYPLYIP
jgi:hypothetical protein